MTLPLRPPTLAIGMMAATALGYEVLLMRLFSIIQWHHFAYMIISLAMLGYGMSGTFLAINKQRLLPRFGHVFVVNQALFAVSAVCCFLLAQQLPFNPEAILFDVTQPLWLLLMYFLFCLPFFFAANCTGLALAYFNTQVGRLYAADLIGAGLGSVAIIALLFVVFPSKALQILGCMGFGSIALAWWEMHKEHPGLSRRLLAGMVLLAGLPLVLPADWLALQLSPYKGLSQTLNIHGTRLLGQTSSPLGLISVVESTEIPLRHAPGLSLVAEKAPPRQLGVFVDGDNMTAIAARATARSQQDYLDQVTSALPYHLVAPEAVLVLGAGGGAEVLQARYFNARQIDGVELNSQMIDLVQSRYGEFAGNLYNSPGVRIHIAEARGFVARQSQQYDLIQLALLDSFSASAAGLYALNESYLYTVEAIVEYLQHLSTQGLLSITRWVELPPRDSLKLFATAIEALKRTGALKPEAQLIMIRGWQTATLLVKNTPFTQVEINRMRQFCEQRLFDVAYYPGISSSEGNRFNVMPQPYFTQATRALLGGERDTFLSRYKYDLHPATDDRPYYFHFFKWRLLPELLALQGQGGMGLLEWGYLLLAATLVQAVTFSTILILLPLWLLRRRASQPVYVQGRFAMFGYFFALGLGFLFLEISMMQKFSLFLQNPLYAAAVVISSFLVFAGLGSRYSARWATQSHIRPTVMRAIACIASIALLYLAGLTPLFDHLLALPTWVRIVLSVLLIMPLAFCMGMPFPLGLSRLSACAPAEIPWVWGVNGCASVLSAILATLLAMQIGFSGVVVSAILIYALAGFCISRPWGAKME